MAPRPPPSRDTVLAALRGQASRLATEPYRFGAPHFTHGVVREASVFRVRRLVYDQEAGTAFARAAQAKGEPFLPEHAERFMRPTGEVVLEAPTLEALLEKLKAAPWPLN